MIGKNNTYRILREFFDAPIKEFQIRELSRRTELAIPTVINHLNKLSEEKLIKKVKGNVYDAYQADINEHFKYYKKLDLLKRVYDSKIIKYLEKELQYPKVIILFGSCVYGEDTEKSDIDLFILAREKELRLNKFESFFKRKISLHFSSVKHLQILKKKGKEYLNNLVNGIVLYGYFELL